MRLESDGTAQLRPKEAAERLGVTTKTLTRMAERGELEFIQLPGGHRRYLESSVDRITRGAA